MTAIPAPPARPRAGLALAGLSLAMFAWLWPIGLGGRMPVGGDVTRFSIGLMAELGRAYRAGRLPLWNDLWGYGFPGLAESQMGVYYPPHLILYGLLPTEAAYTASLVLHTLWAAWGAWWAARRFGAGAIGAALGGFAWAASGFFVIHLPHQWSYTVGSWMPWAWGLAWQLAGPTRTSTPTPAGQDASRRPRPIGGRNTLSTALALSAVLAIQILPGHFQLAFITQVAVLGLALWTPADRPGGRASAWRGATAIVAALLAALPLTAMQLWPTYELARLAQTRRDYEYLSGFAASPPHLVSYLAPGLFHGSPLWRPVAWDPFRTSPEEHLPYIGLVPLLLALGEVRRAYRREPAVRALSWLALGGTLLSLGPYLPGFHTLIRLPGFSYFRAPARWSLAAELALAILAARGLTAIGSGTWKRPEVSLTTASLIVPLLVAAVVGLAEFALTTLSYPAGHPLAASLEGMMAWTPWKGPATLRSSLERVGHPPDDPLIVAGLLRAGEDPARASLLPTRRPIYLRELGPTGAVLAGLLLSVVVGSRRRPWLVAALLIVTAADLLAFGRRLRPIETGPIRSLVAQSPVLAAMSRMPPGTRVADGQGNLAMRPGLAPLPAYRTLDRPIQEGLTRVLSASPVVAGSGRLEIGELLGVGLHVYAQLDLPPYLRGGSILAPWSVPEEIIDEELARWTYGRKGLALLGPIAADFRFWPAPYRPTRAWRLGPGVTVGPDLPNLLPRAFPGVTAETLPYSPDLAPLPWRSPAPGHIEIDVTADRPGAVLVTVLDDPEWQATWLPASGEPGTVLEAPPEPGGVGWIVRTLPRPGRWTLRLEYRGRAAYRGLAISMVSWAVWAGLFACSMRRRRGPNEPNGPATPPTGTGVIDPTPRLRPPNEPNDQDPPT